ncbi:cupin domain-containing protein [Saccharothrix variisporea]|uniref:Mannose-6-phosphate isomerase-like protein (Cupin superfamily) n=1 Tax=Saccharothrix variisporea TaxID=543527 RepID=A0A495XGD5_9PSEU|nr:cupin domain-containing protein [Saccharothrix variisporea]RKT70628.1 mannose-6-phosphate isomerase-like protein (cupin superfamily) [Saccharothrix variisporea]
MNIDQALASFDDLWSPRVLATVNDYDVRVAKVKGEHVWHAHADTDEFFLVLHGELDIALRDRTVHLRQGDTFVVPKDVEHKPSSRDGAHILMIEPTGTVSVGDRHEEVPDHVDITTGHALKTP